MDHKLLLPCQAASAATATRARIGGHKHHVMLAHERIKSICDCLRALESPGVSHEHGHIHIVSLRTQRSPSQAPCAAAYRLHESACGHRSIGAHAAGAAPAQARTTNAPTTQTAYTAPMAFTVDVVVVLYQPPLLPRRQHRRVHIDAAVQLFAVRQTLPRRLDGRTRKDHGTGA